MKISTIIYILIFMGLVGYVFFYSHGGENNSTGNSITGNAILDRETSQENLISPEIKMVFFDNLTQCFLNGQLYVDDFPMGETSDGVFVLNEGEYNSKFKFNSTIALRGRTDSCFGKDSNLPFLRYWSVYDLQYYFENQEELKFETLLNPRQPLYLEEIEGFIQPEEVKPYLQKMNGSLNSMITVENLDKIFAYYPLSYFSDFGQFNIDDYWQLPEETLVKNSGDCEDWALATLSLMKAYDSSVDCYVDLWNTHVSVLCHVGRSFIIYDQQNMRTSRSIDNNSDEISVQNNKASLRKMLTTYFNNYGLSPGEGKISALINETNAITFKDNEDFINWALIN